MNWSWRDEIWELVAMGFKRFKFGRFGCIDKEVEDRFPDIEFIKPGKKNGEILRPIPVYR